jgi:hypothetical protein
MRAVMQKKQEPDNLIFPEDSMEADVFLEKKPMHPEDFRAHLAWVTAKQVCKIFKEKTCIERRFVTG